jgi:phosphinothricin acetyltransferase
MGSATIRRGREADLAELTALYNHYVRETAVTFDVEPYTIEARRPWLAGFAAQGRHQLWVAEQDGRVVGYACSRRFREKAAYDTTAETSVYLEPAATGSGLGRRLYERLFESLAGADLHRLVAGITLPNPASLALHERMGFSSSGVLREVGRKFDRYWDVLWMDRGLP